MNMNIEDVTRWTGVAGFVLAVITLALTRWERRVVLHVGVESGDVDDFAELEQFMVRADASSDTFNLTISNVGARSTVVDIRTVQISANGRVLNVGHEDYFGPQQKEILLKPGDSVTVGVPRWTFDRELGIDMPRSDDINEINRILRAEVRVSTTKGRVHKSKRLQYWPATREFFRK